jgi:hypothetical protein
MILSVVVSAYSFDRVKDLIEVIDGIKNQSYKDISNSRFNRKHMQLKGLQI